MYQLIVKSYFLKKQNEREHKTWITNFKTFVTNSNNSCAKKYTLLFESSYLLLKYFSDCKIKKRTTSMPLVFSWSIQTIDKLVQSQCQGNILILIFLSS